ncbi:hypothetical protein Mapa_006456 [Marchantia paleacea]|nr:hypothetical protein Mapa_006456 [Marchantia paleacea]
MFLVHFALSCSLVAWIQCMSTLLQQHFYWPQQGFTTFHIVFMERNCKARLQGRILCKVILKLKVGRPVRRVDRDGATMRIEKHLDTRTKNMKERIYDKRNFFMTRKIQCMHNVRRIRREQDMQGLMDLWREEQRTFEKECQSAKKEKEKLIGLHDQIHLKAKESKRKQCPICLEKWDTSKERRSFVDTSRICK